MGFNKTASIRSVEDIAKHVLAYAPRQQITQTIIAVDEKAAVAKCADGGFYLVRPQGDRFVVRGLSAENLTSSSEGHVRIDLKDAGFPAFDFHANETELKQMFNRETPQARP